MNTVLNTIAREIPHQTSRFVFPSEIAASRWARTIAGMRGIRSVALNRFLSWKRFKEQLIQAELGDREPVHQVLRKFFVEALIRKNAEAAQRSSSDQEALGSGIAATTGLPFRSLIPLDFAEGGNIFAGQITAILPALKRLKTQREAAALIGEDDEDRDFALLEREYAGFLMGHRLFEPDWERLSLEHTNHHYYLFFPETIEDFAAYEEQLRDTPAITLVTNADTESPASFFYYDSFRAELRATVLELRRLHETEGILYEDMALSVPELEDLEPYILRECSLYNIPVHSQLRQPLADQGTGRLFPLIQDCVANNFSFVSLKSLVLNERLPWRYPTLNRKLIEFGITNNCVSAYRENGHIRDVWIEAFRRSPREERLRRYYDDLKAALRAIVDAESFTELRKQYRAFQGWPWSKAAGVLEQDATGTSEGAAVPDSAQGFLCPDACSTQGDAILGRCMEELSALVELEGEYPECIPVSPFTFYVSVLEKQPGPLGREPGVWLFPYRAAAGAPFTCHFVLNASQKATTVLYQPLKFLRQDKRKRLGLTDTDASAAFFRLYRLEAQGAFKAYSRISAAKETVSGWVIPHSFFSGTTVPAPVPPDPFLLERDWWAAGGSAGNADNQVPFPARLFSIQQVGFKQWRTVLEGSRAVSFNLLKGPFPCGDYAQLVNSRITEKQRTAVSEEQQAAVLLKVSATDLNNFFTCPALWFLQKIFNLEEFSLEANLLDDASLGMLYHEILRKVFTRIRTEDQRFEPRRMEDYRFWVRQYTNEAACQYPAFQGPLAAPILVSLSRAIARRLSRLLQTELTYFAGFSVEELETVLESVQGGILLTGKLDRVSVSRDHEPCIIDYKTGTPPTKKDSTDTEAFPLKNFQMPMYVKLYEEKTSVPVDGAFFMSINQHDITAVVGKPERKQGHDREEYQPTLDALETYIRHFEQAVGRLNFSPEVIPFTDCLTCVYKNICRTTFSLNAGSSGDAAPGTEDAYAL
ncbi:MAG: PD-(D/E)XK nuclease family protein [Treponema sp.]|jgi:hypothetical protein|nr:PD-(D/E)XK nuclease family protein [Treponema sp.]